MKFQLITLAMALAITGSVSTSNVEEASAAEVCGELGVMVVPEGADPANYRKCADHPLGPNPQRLPQSLPPPDAAFAKTPATPRELKGSDIFNRAEQACYYGSGLGCAKGHGKSYCWKACGDPGDGKWCWTAGGDGSGDWLECTTYAQCDPNAACGKGFGCTACGCSC